MQFPTKCSTVLYKLKVEANDKKYGNIKIVQCIMKETYLNKNVFS